MTTAVSDALIERLERKIRLVPDFPKAGILFHDLMPVIGDGPLFAELIDALAARYRGRPIDAIFSPESRGFLFGAPLAARLGCAFVPVRKPGKLPRKTISAPYTIEYGSTDKTLHVHADALAKKGLQVLLVDDVLATGGTAEACVNLAKQLGAEVSEALFVIEMIGLKGRAQLGDIDVFSVLRR